MIPEYGVSPTGNGHSVGTPLLAFARYTDPQIMDDESGLRVPFLDHLADTLWWPGFYSNWPTDSAYRPHEMLSTQLADSSIRAIRNVGTGPLTGLPIKFTITTGDMADNAQRNEQQWSIRLLDGDLLTPKSGTADWSPSGNYGGSSSIAGMEYYWHPENPTPQFRGDYLNHGFPVVTGLMTQARATFRATGIGMPWYVGLGNHDVKVQGNAPLDMLNGSLATIGEWYLDMQWGSLNDIAINGNSIQDVTGLPANFNNLPDSDIGSAWAVLSGAYNVSAYPEANTSQADANRKLLNRAEIVNLHFNTTGSPAGHGFTYGQTVGYYAVPSGPTDLFQFIHLDSNNTNGFGAGGWIDNDQAAWLEAKLKACSSRYRTAPGDYYAESWVNQPNVQDKFVVIYCHHTIETMKNVTQIPVTVFAPEWPADPNPYKTTWVPGGLNGTQLEALLLRFPNVVLMVDGHIHANKIVPHAFNVGVTANHNGFWEVATSSVIDWPNQSRIFEFSNFEDQLKIHTSMVDVDADLVPTTGTTGIDSPRKLATWARWLAANDPQEHPVQTEFGLIDERAGGVDDRNVELSLPMPFNLPVVVPTPMPSLGSDPGQ